MSMIDRSRNDVAAHATQSGEHDIHLRLGHHAVELLQAARDAGDPTLIAHAEAMAMAVGYALAARLSDTVPRED